MAKRGTTDHSASSTTTRFRPSRDAVSNYVGGEMMLIHVGTNRIFKLNRTSRRVWELLATGADTQRIHLALIEEFDICGTELASALQELLAVLQHEGLIESY
jgi:hypothetical protein